MPNPHPGLVPEESAPDQDVQPYTVLALVMNVVRGKDKWGNPDAYTYNRGDLVQLTPDYAEPYLRAGLLESVEPQRPSGKSTKSTPTG